MSQKSITGIGTLAVCFVSFGLLVIIRMLLSCKFWPTSTKWSTLRLPSGMSKTTSQDATEVKQNSTEGVEPYHLPPLRTGTSTQMTMALKRLDQINWLTLDSDYLSEHHLRSSLLSNSRPNVIQCLPESTEACHETLSIIANFLATRYPAHFSVSSSPPTIQNQLPSESFHIGPDCLNPLEVAARLAMEDFNILQKDSETGEYRLIASATLFPAGWRLQERIGSSLARLHAPVPGWKEKLGRSVNRFVHPFFLQFFPPA